ncbi:MAG: nucleoside-diphosphate kinase [Odoribacter splanchnicus]
MTSGRWSSWYRKKMPLLNWTLIGNTDQQAAPTGSIRKIFGQSKTRNAIHGSDSDENALREIHFFFSEREIVPEPYRLPIPEAEIDS